MSFFCKSDWINDLVEFFIEYQVAIVVGCMEDFSHMVYPNKYSNISVTDKNMKRVLIREYIDKLAGKWLYRFRYRAVDDWVR